MPVRKTQEEIVSRIESKDWVLPFGRNVLIPYLEYENAEQYLKDGATKEEWQDKETKDPLQSAEEYMDFARKKARNRRSNSATRSIDKMREWLWLAGEDEVLQKFEEAEYKPYGKPKLNVLEEEFGW